MNLVQMAEHYRKYAGQPYGLNTTDVKTKDLAMAALLVEEEWKEVEEAFEGPFGLNDEELLKEFADLIYVIAGYCSLVGWNLDEALNRVHNNNIGRMIQPDGTIKYRDDGKVIKNKEYPKVDLKDLV